MQLLVSFVFVGFVLGVFAGVAHRLSAPSGDDS